jgi:hypothetical protein
MLIKSDDDIHGTEAFRLYIEITIIKYVTFCIQSLYDEPFDL